MNDRTIVFETNAPVEELKKLEIVSNDVYINGGSEEEVPIWAKLLKERGYNFDYIDEHQHVTAYGSSAEWLKSKYDHVKEYYIIDNQPNIEYEYA